MNLESFITSNTVADIGWTLLHSIWQITLLSAMLLLVSSVLRRHSPNVRYGISVAALIIAFVLPLVTFVQTSTLSNSSRVASSLETTTNGRGPRANGVADTTSVGEQGAAIAVGERSDVSMIAGLRSFLDTQVPNLLPFAVVLWLFGVAFFALRLGGGIWQLHVYKTVDVEPVDVRWKEFVSSLCTRLGIAQNVTVLKSSLVKTPIALGTFKPLILVPASLFFQITPRELETIIAHELLHIRRYDPLVNLLQSVVETILFYHPGVWWISKQVSREREFATDADVLSLFNNSHITYARALANLEEIRLMADQQLPRHATAANGGNLMQRISKILQTKTEIGRANSAWTAGLAFLLISAVLTALFSFNSPAYVNAENNRGGRKLAIGFVSIPPLDRTADGVKDGEITTRLLIHALKRYKVPATGFLAGGMISDGENFLPAQRDIARMWIDAGYEVGLGGFKHISLYHTPVDDYIANIEKNERIAKKLLGDMGFPPRYFSYPYLNKGKTTEDSAKVEAWLNQRGYTSVKYTFDNQEWMYSWAYDIARNEGDADKMKEVREGYLAYMSKMFDHYEAYSSEMFGRDIAQTMVLTPSRLVADTADELFSTAVKRGYKFISVDEAQGDPAYKTSESFVGDAGISWFERWSMAKGKKLLDEPNVDSAVSQMWASRSKK